MQYPTAVLCLFVLVLFASNARAQTPSAAGNGLAAKPEDVFTPGWTLGARFEGSSSGDGAIFDLGTAIGYNFSHHFGIDAGVPYYFVRAPSSIKKKKPNAVSGVGVGSFFTDLKLNFPGKALNYDSIIHLTAPTGDTKKGFSTGHATWNWTNHFEHGWGNFTPYLDAVVGNTVADTRFFHRPFITFGYNAQFEAGTEFEAGPFSLTASAYDVAPWGPQTVISRVFRCSSGGRDAPQTGNPTIVAATRWQASERVVRILSGTTVSMRRLSSSLFRTLTLNSTTAGACLSSSTASRSGSASISTGCCDLDQRDINTKMQGKRSLARGPETEFDD